MQITIGHWLKEQIIASYMPGFKRIDNEADEVGGKDYEEYDCLLDQQDLDFDLVEIFWS